MAQPYSGILFSNENESADRCYHMEETWKHFTVTGKVTDYLKFCEEREKQEVKPDGDKPNSDRDGYRYHANRGV